ncbi:MAG: Pyruvate kinase [Anaerolineales bacterium]|nr:Pyruvate kinase [Anaerolineales bacterium]
MTINRKAKIVSTIGPASESEEALRHLIQAGLNVARLNFSHGTHEQHAARIRIIRKISAELQNPVAILQDLQGPKIRVGTLPAPIQLTEGERIRLFAEEDAPPQESIPCVPVGFEELFASVRTGDRLLLDDGRLTLQVESSDARALTARVVVGGPLSSNKGINLPGVRLAISGFTEKDEADLAFGLAQGVDAVAISFVRSADDVLKVRTAMKRHGYNGGAKRAPLLIAKLEKPEVFEDLDRILEVVDGVMVARGDLGVEMPPEKVPVLQKRIIKAANAHAKLVITATQMLESMIQNPLPTRAEASDVANAIFDGTDAVMLSAETASGKYPVEAVTLMSRIVIEAESHFLEWGASSTPASLGDSDAASMARAACEIARDRDVAAIAVFTMQGRTAQLISKAHPNVSILAFTPEEETCRRLALLWGVIPRLVPFVNTTEDMIRYVENAMLQQNMVQRGQQVALVCGFPVGALRTPNMLLLHTVGS